MMTQPQWVGCVRDDVASVVQRCRGVHTMTVTAGSQSDCFCQLSDLLVSGHVTGT